MKRSSWTTGACAPWSPSIPTTSACRWRCTRRAPPDREEDGETIVGTPGEWEQVNRATALWTRNPKDIKDEEYQEFYKHVAHDFEDPLLWGHNRVEGAQEYASLLYIPARAPFDLYNREQKHGLKLYVQRVFIMDDAEQFMPTYLRFVKGVLDSNNLPLNVSREILQDNKVTASLRKACSKRVLTMLNKLAKDDSEKYAKFWSEFGNVLKEARPRITRTAKRSPSCCALPAPPARAKPRLCRWKTTLAA